MPVQNLYLKKLNILKSEETGDRPLLKLVVLALLTSVKGSLEAVSSALEGRWLPVLLRTSSPVLPGHFLEMFPHQNAGLRPPLNST